MALGSGYQITDGCASRCLMFMEEDVNCYLIVDCVVLKFGGSGWLGLKFIALVLPSHIMTQSNFVVSIYRI